MTAAIITLAIAFAGCVGVIAWLAKKAFSATEKIAKAEGAAADAQRQARDRFEEVESLTQALKLSEAERHTAAARAGAAASIPRARAASYLQLLENHAKVCDDGPQLVRDLSELARRGMPMPPANPPKDGGGTGPSEAVPHGPAPIETLR